MVTLDTNYTIQRYVCLSTDTKPSASNGSLLLEMDTGIVYVYDETGESWREVNIPW